jgi:hypothetical protein
MVVVCCCSPGLEAKLNGNRTLICVAFALVFSGIFVSSSFSQQPSRGADHKVDPKGVYLSVLNSLFPIAQTAPAKTYLAISLRFVLTDPDQPESQINITEDVKGAFHVTEYRLPRGAKPIWIQLRQLSQQYQLTQSNPTDLGKRFGVRSRVVNIPQEEVKDLLKTLSSLPFPWMPTNPNEGLRLADADNYDLWYKALTLTEVHVSYTDAGRVVANGGQPLFDWMEKVRRTIDAIP